MADRLPMMTLGSLVGRDVRFHYWTQPGGSGRTEPVEGTVVDRQGSVLVIACEVDGAPVTMSVDLYAIPGCRLSVRAYQEVMVIDEERLIEEEARR